MKFQQKPFSAVDLTLFKFKEGKLFTYLIQTSVKHFYKQWAFPGSLVSENETLEEAANRVYFESTGNKQLFLEQLYTFSNPLRDPRSRSISTAYLGFPHKEDKIFSICSKYLAGQWFDVKEIKNLAYDHNEILTTAINRIAIKLEYSTIAFLLLPSIFTLTDLQILYEYFLNKTIDKRNFRKKFLSLNLLQETSDVKMGEKARPAKFYTPLDNTLKIISIF